MGVGVSATCAETGVGCARENCSEVYRRVGSSTCRERRTKWMGGIFFDSRMQSRHGYSSIRGGAAVEQFQGSLLREGIVPGLGVLVREHLNAGGQGGV